MSIFFLLIFLLFNYNINCFLGDWQQFQNGYSTEQCYRIPENLTLCNNVGYKRMILPNYIQHEYLDETVQHSKVWIGLVNSQCHEDIRKFLCSLYAPVCINNMRIQKVPPCNELCIRVKEACLPSMKLFGFEWPNIMKCSLFPSVKNSLCIPSTISKGKKCRTCVKGASYEIMANKFCLSTIVIRAKIKKIKSLEGNGFKIQLSPKSKFIKFQSNLTQNSIKIFLHCNCSKLKFEEKAYKGKWLIMANVINNQTTVNFLTKWKKRNVNFRNSINVLRKFGNELCRLNLPNNSDGRTSMLKRYLAYAKMNEITKFKNRKNRNNRSDNRKRIVRELQNKKDGLSELNA
uniref:SFRP-1 n=1 Tax=Dendrocoelum lacteum TaxID=27895 RepID=T1E103_9PLAT